MQTSFSVPAVTPYAGCFLNTNGSERVNTKYATYATEFGRRLSYDDDDKKAVSEMATDQAVLTLDADTVTSNTFACTLKIMSKTDEVEASSAISVAFDTDHDTTMANVITAFEAVTNVNAAGTAVSGSDNRILTIKADSGYMLEISSEAITGGASQAGITKVNSDTRAPAGFAAWQDKEPFEISGSMVSKFKLGESIPNINAGNVSVDSVTGFDGADSLYIVGYGTDRGKVNNAAGDNGIAVTDIAHYQTAAAAGRGAVAINKP